MPYFPPLSRRRLVALLAASLLGRGAAAQRIEPPPRQLLVKGEGLAAPGDDGLRPVPVALRIARRIARGVAVMGDANDPDIAVLRALRRRGRASGLAGDLYDNRDRAHSRMGLARFPQLTPVVYDDAARAGGLDYGLNDRLRFDAIVLGNSSTAFTAGQWRSHPRDAMTRPGKLARVAALYAANHLYVYPEHRDHDPEPGDLFPANTPCMLISQGSSGSDRPFLDALAMTLAALRPDAKAALKAKGLIAPALQMALRRGVAQSMGVDYLDPAAHPVVFDSESLDRTAMLRAAQALRADAIPPAPQLAVLEESAPRDPVGLFGDGLSETLFDTSAACARVIRAAGAFRRYRLSAAETVDPNGRTLRFHWRVLSEPGAARLRGEGAEAVLDLDLRGLFDGTRRRIDILLVADNGVAASAPAFFSVALPGHERRDYAADGRLLFADYGAETGYVDPVLYPARPWRDLYQWDAEGRLLGWRRETEDARAEFARNGARVLSRDAQDRPLDAVGVAYPRASAAGRLRVAPQEDGRLFRFVYDGPSDRIGRILADPGLSVPGVAPLAPGPDGG